MLWLLLLTCVVIIACLLVAYLPLRKRYRLLESRLATANSDLQNLQQSCARLAPGNVVDRLITGGPTATAERKEVTALFADLVGYTAISERLEPAQLARILNGYFQRMSDAITANHGHISTFVGDGILAYFGALEPNPWQCNDAVKAALAMRAGLADYNKELAAEGLPELGLGVGLHYGPGLAGMVGSSERMEYAFVGRTVNLAARVESLTRTHKVDILITEAVRDKLDPQVQLKPMPATLVKGIEQPVLTFAVIQWPQGNTAQ